MQINEPYFLSKLEFSEFRIFQNAALGKCD